MYSLHLLPMVRKFKRKKTTLLLQTTESCGGLLTISLGARSVVPATRPQSSTVREQMPRKRRETRSHDFDQEVVKEINRQTQIQQEIEDRRKKRIWIFWSLVISGAVVVTAAVLAFLFLLLEWQVIRRNYNKDRLNIDFHLVETCSPYKRRDETDGRIFTMYTLRIVNGPKPPETKTTTKTNKKLYGLR